MVSSIFFMALFPIYVGSYRALNRRGKFVLEGNSYTFKKKSDNKGESMSSQDAYMFPIIGSGVLFGLYMLFRIFSKEYINLLLTVYFLGLGIGSLYTTLAPTVENLSMLSNFKKKKWNYSFTPFWSKAVQKIKFNGADLVTFIISCLIGLWYVTTKHWISNNILGLAFSIQGIAMLSLGSYKVGCILLSGLFFYDIFWVFATDVMVTVARSFDAPIKLIFPKSLFASEYQFSMLGLGDIVIPGIFIALLLRFDAQQSNKHRVFDKVYFSATFIAYMFGLITTIAIMTIFNHAQPALLYLVPACIGVSFLVALWRGEVRELFKYSEEDKKKTKKSKSPKSPTTSKHARKIQIE